MTGYVPREGSVAQRVIWHLEQHGACSSKRLADEVDDVAASGLPANLATAVRLGAIFVRKVDGECWYDVKPFAPGAELDGIDMDRVRRRRTNALTVGMSPAADGSQKPDGAAVSLRVEAGSDTPTERLQHVLKAEAATPPDATDRSPTTASPGVGPMGAGQAADAAPAEDPPFRCALWSDGSFMMFLPDGTDVSLTPDETKVLVRYLDRLAEEVAP